MGLRGALRPAGQLPMGDGQQPVGPFEKRIGSHIPRTTVVAISRCELPATMVAVQRASEILDADFQRPPADGTFLHKMSGMMHRVLETSVWHGKRQAARV